MQSITGRLVRPVSFPPSASGDADAKRVGEFEPNARDWSCKAAATHLLEHPDASCNGCADAFEGVGKGRWSSRTFAQIGLCDAQSAPSNAPSDELLAAVRTTPGKHPRERVRDRTEEAAQACALFKTPEKKPFAESAMCDVFVLGAIACRRRASFATGGRRRGDHIAEKKMSQVVDSAKKRD